MQILKWFFLGFIFTVELRATASEDMPIDYFPTCWSYGQHYLNTPTPSLVAPLAQEVCTSVNVTGKSFSVNGVEDGLNCYVTICKNPGAIIYELDVLNWMRDTGKHSTEQFDGMTLPVTSESEHVQLFGQAVNSY